VINEVEEAGLCVGSGGRKRWTATGMAAWPFRQTDNRWVRGGGREGGRETYNNVRQTYERGQDGGTICWVMSSLPPFPPAFLGPT
jgi:hypothetical protein